MTYTVTANHTQGWLARGGRLTVEGADLTFSCNPIDRILFGRSLRVPVSDVVGVDVAPRGSNPFNGSLRRRVSLQLANGQQHLFVVSNVELVVEQLRRTVGLA